jgi:hypothetical protein
VSAGVSVDLFVLNNSYVDVATIGQVCRLTGGEVYKYTYFQADVDGPRLIADVTRNISRPVAFDAIMRVRTSTGVRPTDFFGHYYMSNTTDMELAAVDSDKVMKCSFIILNTKYILGAAEYEFFHGFKRQKKISCLFLGHPKRHCKTHSFLNP